MRTKAGPLALLLAAFLPVASLRAATNLLPGPDQLAPGTANANTAATPLDLGGPAPNPRALFQRDLALGDLGGLRGELRQKGVAVSPVYLGEVMGNPVGGIEPGATADGLLNVALDLDLGLLSGGQLHDLTLHANALWLHGQGLSVRKVGDFSGVSNIAGYNTVRLQEIWVEQAVWNQHFTLRLGVLAADAEFFNTSNGALFLNGTFGAFTLVGVNLPNPPIYPEASPGVRISVHPTPSFLLRAGVYGGDSGGTQDQNDHGTNFNLRRRDGALILAEAQYLLNQSPGATGRQGTYQVGAFVHTGGAFEYRGADYGVYAVIDQDFLKTDRHSVSGFLRLGGAPGDANFVDFYADGGFNFKGWFPGRPNDVAGIGIAYSSVSDEFSHGSSYETVIEATYKLQLAPWWSVQPDLQCVFNPGGANDSHDALVLGIRTAVSF